ncbi:CIC family chloride channel protein [Desulfobotulus alkaliphilus]|uniref:CIC family chloride channel protein n=1 Tax=Desulfobotulus alkaliphilus TaxID=622671 RepID=A0A562RRW5_9BACT|nr:chloride channel protein [Desulfobotulus alkaliphilus]TWI71802.1 CIC family chloride channel protein [Desulfobotulus alkaliphilus]
MNMTAWMKKGWSWLRTHMDPRLFMMLMAIVVGIFGGLAAVLLHHMIEMVAGLFSGYRQRAWSFLLPAMGAAAAVYFMEKIVREGGGHGVPEVIYAVSRHGGLIRLRSTFSRIFASSMTIGSGGSAGPEAPVVMSGAAIGSNIGRILGLNERQRVVLVGCGAASAIGSIFNAPVAGMVFTMEVLLGQWRSSHLLPITLAAVTGTQLSRRLHGNQIPFESAIFGIQMHDTLASAGLALITAVVAIGLIRGMRRMHGLSLFLASRCHLSPWTRAGIGGLFVGMIGIFFPVVLGEGYYAVREMIAGEFSSGIIFVLVILLAKMLATTFTLGWGGIGGIFAPSLVMGAMAGLLYHRILVFLFPAVGWVNEGCFALLGMAGLLAGVLQAPLTAIFLIFEITGGYEVVLPLMVVSAFSTILCRYGEPHSIYLKDLVARDELLRPGTDGRVLLDLRISEVMEKDCIPVQRNMLLRNFIHLLKNSRRNYFPVEDAATGRFVGMVHLDDVRPYLLDQMLYDTVLMEQLMHRNVMVVHPDDELGDILETMDRLGLFSMPVVADHRFMGMISKATLLDHYRKELRVQTSDE